jgi:hypothetical protein
LIVGKKEKEKEKEKEMADPMFPLCLFCLEEIKETQEAPNVVGCGCEIHTHPKCLQAWFEQKQEVECPICHTVSVPNPVHVAPQQQNQREIVIIHVQASDRDERFLRLRSHEISLGLCCCILIFWWIGGIILQYAF